MFADGCFRPIDGCYWPCDGYYVLDGYFDRSGGCRGPSTDVGTQSAYVHLFAHARHPPGTFRGNTSVGQRLHPKHRLMRLCTPCTSSPSIPSFSSTCTPSEIERPQRQGSHLHGTQVALQRPRFASALAQYEESADTTIVRARPRAIVRARQHQKPIVQRWF